jgi:hypothetical protein
MKFEKELEILQKMVENPVEEHIVRVYDSKTKEVNLHKLDVKEGRLNSHVAWSLFFHKHNGEIFETRDKYLLSEALNDLREELEKENKLIIVRGADRDCAASGMQADMSAGASISKLEMSDRLNRGKNINWSDYTFYVLEDSRIECVTTIAEQEEYHSKWWEGKLKKLSENMKTVWKFELKVELLQELSIPINSLILSVVVIKDIGYLWVEVFGDTTNTQKIKILTVPTGAEFQKKTEFIGTLMYRNGEIVQHIFKVIEE